jgi:phage terminase small subunit
MAKKKAASKRGGKRSKGAKPATGRKPDKSLQARKKAEPRSRHDIFVDEYLVDLNGAAAAIRAGYAPGCARQTAYELLGQPSIAAKVKAAMDERAARTQVTQDYVVHRLQDMVEADPREISRIERRCCRYCWGRDNRYQFTHAELQMSRAEYERKLIKDDPSLDDERFRLEEKMEEFDTRGGGGFDPKADPNPKCQECGGEGVEEVVFGDARELSAGGRLLYAGTKKTEKGIEVKTHSRFEALKMLGQHLGMFTTKIRHSNDPDNPMPAACGFAMIPPKEVPDGDRGAGG